MAPDLLLKPVLVELGATCPAPGVYLHQDTYAEDGRIDAYVQRWGPALHAATGTAAGSRA